MSSLIVEVTAVEDDAEVISAGVFLESNQENISVLYSTADRYFK